MSLLSGKRLLLLGFVVVLLVIIPLTVYLVQQQQKLKVGATPQTTLSFNPASTSVTSGQNFSLDVSLDPGTNPGNQVSFVKLTIQYDPTKVATTGAGLAANTAIFPSVLQGPTYTSNTASITLSVGSNSQNVISTVQPKIATINFQALNTSAAAQTQVSFVYDTTQNSPTQILSVAPSDQFSENVLASPQSATIAIAPSTASPSASASPTASPTPTPSGATSQDQPPVCNSLSLDRAASGVAPYALTFTANGTDSDGTISKVEFQFGDGQIQDVTTGLGTKTVNISASHNYQNAGTYTAKAVLTDNANLTNTSDCTQTITVAAAAAGPTSTTQTVTVATATPSATPIVAATPTPIAQGPTTKGGLPATGPGDNIVSFGTLGAISTIVGLLILFGL